MYVILCTPHSKNTLYIANQHSLFFWQFWKGSNYKLSIGTIGDTCDIKDLLSKQGWKLTLGLAGQWEEGGIFKGQSQT